MAKPKRARKKKRAKKKIDPFIVDKSLVIDYKNTDVLNKFVTDRGKIIPRRISGVNAKHQRELVLAIKRARNIALMPYTVLGD